MVLSDHRSGVPLPRPPEGARSSDPSTPTADPGATTSEPISTGSISTGSVGREIGPFAAVGVANVALNVALFDLLVRWAGSPVLLASVIATVVTTVSSYLLNRVWTFSHRNPTAVRSGLLSFAAVNLVAMVLETAVLAVGLALIPAAGPLLRILLKVLGVCAGTVLRFVGYRAWVFRPAPTP